MNYHRANAGSFAPIMAPRSGHIYRLFPLRLVSHPIIIVGSSTSHILDFLPVSGYWSGGSGTVASRSLVLGGRVLGVGRGPHRRLLISPPIILAVSPIAGRLRLLLGQYLGSHVGLLELGAEALSIVIA